jgi:3-isopropylmalate/(R)-2-methylmalate dehydratase small subunit
MRSAGDAEVKAWVLGDNIDTDVITPGKYMKFGIEEIAKHCLEPVLPEFSKQVKPGDIVVAGRNFGAGSSREQAPAALKHLGVAALIAESFAGLFYRNSLNLGLPALVCAEAKRIRDGDRLSLDFEKALVVNESTGQAHSFEPIPPHLLEMVRDGGLIPHLEKRLARTA